MFIIASFMLAFDPEAILQHIFPLFSSTFREPESHIRFREVESLFRNTWEIESFPNYVQVLILIYKNGLKERRFMGSFVILLLFPSLSTSHPISQWYQGDLKARTASMVNALLSDDKIRNSAQFRDLFFLDWVTTKVMGICWRCDDAYEDANLSFLHDLYSKMLSSPSSFFWRLWALVYYMQGFTIPTRRFLLTPRFPCSPFLVFSFLIAPFSLHYDRFRSDRLFRN